MIESIVDINILQHDRYSTINLNGTEVKVAKYLPIKEKYDVVNITLQKAYENGIYNPIKLDMYFHLNLIYSYTDLIFTETEKEDEMYLYDQLAVGGVIDTIIAAIPADEYNTLFNMLNTTEEKMTENNNTLSGALRTYAESISAGVDKALNALQGLDLSKYQDLLGLVKQTGGNILDKTNDIAIAKAIIGENK